MAKNNRLSRDQKRKAKLKKRAEKSRRHEPLAYAGKKYKTEQYVPAVYRTELGIYESYAMSGRTLTDDEVEEALEDLVLRMREGPQPATTDPDASPSDAEEGVLIGNIRRNWRYLAEEGAHFTREDLIGVVRTLLHSLAFWRSHNMHPQGYLHYLEGFMKDMGVSVSLVAPDAVASLDSATEQRPGPDPAQP